MVNDDKRKLLEGLAEVKMNAKRLKESVERVLTTSLRIKLHEARKQSVQKCVRSLVHACQCRDENCRQPSCPKMKKVVEHMRMCKRRLIGGCPVCKQVVVICCHHAKFCPESQCLVPFCCAMKQKLKQQSQRSQRTNSPQTCSDRQQSADVKSQSQVAEDGCEQRPNSPPEIQPQTSADVKSESQTSPLQVNQQQQQQDKIYKSSLRRCLHLLAHASQCKDENCSVPNCPRMKKLVSHIKICKQRTFHGCSICKQILALCYHHAKYCQESKCPVVLCGQMKLKLKQYAEKKAKSQTSLN